MAAFLVSFTEALVLDLRYREGARETHQWLEFTTRPSNRTFVCDIYVSDGCDGSSSQAKELLNMPAEVAYQHVMYPNGKLNVFSGSSVTTLPVRDTDFAA